MLLRYVSDNATLVNVVVDPLPKVGSDIEVADDDRVLLRQVVAGGALLDLASYRILWYAHTSEELRPFGGQEVVSRLSLDLGDQSCARGRVRFPTSFELR